ncbi:MAG: hypothetical protein WAV47_26435 [Blastocatellia bacterium]
MERIVTTVDYCRHDGPFSEYRIDQMYEMYVKKRIELGIKAADEGRVVPHEEVKRIFSVE